MTVPFDPTDPSHLSPEQRLGELTALLAAGLRRAMSMRQPVTPAATTPITETPSDSPRSGLDVSAEKSVHGPRG